MPFPWFEALRRTDRNEGFAADQLQRYGYLPNPAANGSTPLPVGFVRDGSASEPYLGMTCAACHTGQIRYKGLVWRVDGGRADADFQSFLIDLGSAVRATLAEPGRFAGFSSSVLGGTATPSQRDRLRRDLETWSRKWDSFMSAALPDLPWGPGRLDAFGMIFNRVAGLDLKIPANIRKADAPVRYPFIWDAPRQDWTQWTGAAPNGTYMRGMARNAGEVFGVFGRFDPVRLPLGKVDYQNRVDLPGLQTLEEKVVALRAPRWPREVFGLDPARAARGEQIFKAECASCHGIQPSPTITGAWATPRVDVGTDRRTFDNSQVHGSPGVLIGTRQPPLVGQPLGPSPQQLAILANAVTGSLFRGLLLRDEGVRRAIRRDLENGHRPNLTDMPEPEAVVAGAGLDLYRGIKPPGPAAYEARVLTGIWAVGPYLHNGSVPNLWELLKPARERVTRFAVAHREFDPVHVGLETEPGPRRRMFVVDQRNGNGNGGHEYGTALPEAERWALIEYLKTL